MQEIAKALVNAQKGFANPKKSADNPFFKSKYADLASCTEAVMPSLHENGIAVIQNCHESDTGVIVETVFIHESGETISTGKLHVPAAKHDAQGYGSALTYARRYSLMAACGMAPEDDDGNAAAKATKKTATPDPDGMSLIRGAKSLDELKDIWRSLSVEQRGTLGAVKDAKKSELEDFVQA